MANRQDDQSAIIADLQARVATMTMEVAKLGDRLAAEHEINAFRNRRQLVRISTLERLIRDAGLTVPRSLGDHDSLQGGAGSA